MQRFANWLLWIVVMVIVVLSVLNWNTLMTPAPIELMVLRIEAPLGVIMVGLTGVLILLFFVATLRNQISTLLESNRLNKEIRRLQSAGEGTLSRELSSLREQMQARFDRIDARLDAARPVALTPDRPDAA